MARKLALKGATLGLVAASALALASCMSIWAQPEANAPPPAATTQLPPPAPAQRNQPAPTTTTALTLPSGAAAPNVPAPPPDRRTSSNEEVVVPGTQERQVTPPPGDPRSVSERAADIRSWDACVLRAQAHTSSDPMKPQLDSPEELCRRTLGMRNRTAVPDSRRP